MNILFIHQAFPGQFMHLSESLASDPANRVVALHLRHDLPPLPSIQTIFSGSAIQRGVTPGLEPWLAEIEMQSIRAEATLQTAMELRATGFMPDLICAHPGWGEALYIQEVWPDARLLCYFEYFYQPRAPEFGFDPEFPMLPGVSYRTRLKNFTNLQALEACDAGICPTEFQFSPYPAAYKNKIYVIHDGIDTDTVVPNHAMHIQLGDERCTKLTRQDEVITFVSRNLEPYRGWHIFARALPEILARRPAAHVLIVGGDGVSYGRRPTDGVSYKQKYLSEVLDSIDIQRVHFLDIIPYESFLAVLQISSVHVYLTFPFVLSWSMLEAMSAEALVVGSRTAPVTEVIRHGENGLLVDFFSPAELAATVSEVLDHPDRMQAVRSRARQTIIERYDLKRHCLPQQLELIQNLVAKK